MAFTKIDFAIEGDVGVLTLKRPEVLNALDIEMAREIRALSDTLRTAPPARAVIVTGAGRAFSAGGDLSSVKQGQAGMKERSLDITGELHRAMLNFANMDTPIVAAVNGFAAGAGFALVCACDIAVAAASAKFMAAYTLAGLSPDLGLTYTLPRRIGMGAAKNLILSNKTVLAADAKTLGIVSDVVPDDQLITSAKALCREILKGSSAAIGTTKRLLLQSWTATYEQQLRDESRHLAELSASDESFARCQKFVK